jgi:hypothetical protein
VAGVPSGLRLTPLRINNNNDVTIKSLYDDHDDTLLGFYRCKLHQNLGKKKINCKGDGTNDSHLDIWITISIVTRLGELQPEERARFLVWAIDLFSTASRSPLGSPSLLSNGYLWLLPRELKRPGLVSFVVIL